MSEKEKQESSVGVEVLNPLEAAIKTENIEIDDDDLEDINLDEDQEEKSKSKKDEIDLTDDAEDSEDEDLEDEEPDEDDSDEEEEAKEDDIKPVKFSEEYKQAKTQMNSLAERIQDIIEEVEILQPEKPKDMDDIDEADAYEQELREYKRQSKIANKKIERIQDKIKDHVRTLQGEFAKNHSGEDLKGFEDWMRKREGFMAEFLSGREDLEAFYYLYKSRNSGTKLDKVKKISKGKKEVSIETDAAPKDTVKTILPKQYKFANKPMFREWVTGYLKDKKAGRTMPDGTPITYALIEDLCKQEYQLNNLKQNE